MVKIDFNIFAGGYSGGYN